MVEERKLKTCAIVEDGNNIVKVEWDIYRNMEYSHTYEQYYTSETIDQFVYDVGLEIATPILFQLNRRFV